MDHGRYSNDLSAVKLFRPPDEVVSLWRIEIVPEGIGLIWTRGDQLLALEIEQNSSCLFQWDVQTLR